MRISELEQLRTRLQMDMAGFDGAWKTQGDRLIGTVSPFPDEAFSSWCERVSLQFKVKRELVLERLGIQIPASWVDAGRAELDVRKAAYLTGIAPGKLADFNAATNTLMPAPQYAYLTSNPLMQRQVFRFCEQCLLEDVEPYGRRLWRLSFAHLCPKHRTILRDKCPNCNRRISNNYLVKRRQTSLRTCCSCNYNLGTATPAFLPELETLIMSRRQAWWVRLLSALDSFQNGPQYWYGNFDPDWVHEAIGQLRGVQDGPFIDLLLRTVGRVRLAAGDRLILKRGTLECLFEENNPYLHRPNDLELEDIPWRRIYIGGEYANLRNAHDIAKALRACHDLTDGGDLWHMWRNVPVPHELTEVQEQWSRRTYRWVNPSKYLPMKRDA